MKPVFLLTFIAAAATLLAGCASTSTSSLTNAIGSPTGLPPLPADLTELKFSEFFVSPVGPRGLVLTDKLANLDGKRVRMVGYMVEQHEGPPGKFIFSALPLQLHDHDSALADDLPASVVHVTVPTCVGREVPHVPGLMLLTGRLNVGHRDEADGRTSFVRMDLDPPENFADSRRSH